MEKQNNTIADVLDFWYSDEVSKHWFTSTPELDVEIKQRFESLWQDAATHKLDSWQIEAEGCLALCIVLDQFPLNMFRSEEKSFETEQQAVDVAVKAIEFGFDMKIEISKVSFLYMPLMHSENMADQDLSIACFQKRELDHNLRFAEHHRDIIRRFGRFPHRNEILGRESSQAESDYLNSKEAFTG
jgi:uncharacterized protein (DUF924 family)